jgi:LuxR family transcriptional regulator, maltose regulon positive regulatory protein
VAALRRAGLALRTAPPFMRGRDARHVFLLWLAAALAAQDPPVTLVLDDMHLMTDPEVLDGLDYVLRNVGPGLRLVVSGRMVPLPLHRYRLAGDLTEIRAGDLAFTTAEAGLLLARHGITLTADSLERLTRRTEGWAAGLRLAAISMSTHPDPGQFVTELITDDSAITGYLVQEVLNTQPSAVRDILLSTSILEHLSVQAASELTGNEQAGRILPPLRGRDSSMSSASAADDEPFVGPSARLATALVTRWPLRSLPSVKALGDAAVASRSGSA